MDDYRVVFRAIYARTGNSFDRFSSIQTVNSTESVCMNLFFSSQPAICPGVWRYIVTDMPVPVCSGQATISVGSSGLRSPVTKADLPLSARIRATSWKTNVKVGEEMENTRGDGLIKGFITERVWDYSQIMAEKAYSKPLLPAGIQHLFIHIDPDYADSCLEKRLRSEPCSNADIEDCLTGPDKP
jgi:hypothetical protein